MSKVVVLDPGHGGSDPGAVSTDLREKDLTLKIAKRVRDTLVNNYNVTVKMTRSTDEGLTLRERTNYANRLKADYFCSIHINAGGGTGYEDYIHSSLSNSSKTAKLRSTVHDEVKKVLNKYGIRNRGKKKDNFHVLRETKMSAMLSENLFIDTAADQKLLKNNSFLTDIADAHAHGIAKALGLKKKNTSKPSPAPKPTPSNGLYKVQIGAFSSKKNAETLASNAKKAGFDTYIVRE